LWFACETPSIEQASGWRPPGGRRGGAPGSDSWPVADQVADPQTRARKSQ